MPKPVILAPANAMEVMWADYLRAMSGAGQFAAVEWTTHDVSNDGSTLSRTTRTVVRGGVDYANMAQNAGRDIGPLPYGQWAVTEAGVSLFPWIYVHTPKGSTSLVSYARLYLVKGAKFDTVHLVDNVRVTADEYVARCKVKPRKSRGTDDNTRGMKLANVRVLGPDGQAI